MPDIKLLVPAEWPILRDIRLRALRDSPHAFLSSYELESAYDERHWRREFRRGRWTIGAVAGRAVGLLGETRGADTAADERYLEYLWIAPGHRRSGLALILLTSVLGQLRTVGIRTVYLWVLDGNDRALRLYRRVGFVTTGLRQPLAGRPGVSEERFALNLAAAQQSGR